MGVFSSSSLVGVGSEWIAATPSFEEFHFESGPSLYSGLSLEESPSQLKHVSLPLRGGEGIEVVLIVMDVWLETTRKAM